MGSPWHPVDQPEWSVSRVLLGAGAGRPWLPGESPVAAKALFLILDDSSGALLGRRGGVVGESPHRVGVGRAHRPSVGARRQGPAGRTEKTTHWSVMQAGPGVGSLWSPQEGQLRKKEVEIRPPGPLNGNCWTGSHADLGGWVSTSDNCCERERSPRCRPCVCAERPGWG